MFRSLRHLVLKLLGASAFIGILINTSLFSYKTLVPRYDLTPKGVVIAGKHYLLIERQDESKYLAPRGKGRNTQFPTSKRKRTLAKEGKPLQFSPSRPPRPTLPPSIFKYNDAVIIQDIIEKNKSLTEKRHRVFVEKQMITDSKNTQHKSPWGQLTICKAKTYELDKYGSVSIIIAFHDHEQVSLILHTVHSILQRTPKSLLKEILLIDDGTKKHDLKQLLDIYSQAVFDPSVVRIHRSQGHLGLIRARNLGIKLASGSIVVCMDSHMEVQPYWLEALLVEIHYNPKTLATSYLDWFQYNSTTDTWEYSHGGRNWVTFFDWQLTFGFQKAGRAHIVKNDPTAPVMSMVTVGTIWAMDRKFFLEIGALDDGMEGWGGENLDLAIRVWLFGGRVVNVPCSNAAHYENQGYRDYRIGWEKQFYRNYKRVTEVWFDDYKKWVYYYMPQVEAADAGDITARYSLKEKAKNNMTWFLNTIYPELNVPDRDSFAFGGIVNEGLGACIETISVNRPAMYPCGKKPARQNFMWNINGELRFPAMVFNIEATAQGYVLKAEGVIPRFNSFFNAHWIHWLNGPIMEYKTKLCLEAQMDFTLLLRKCNFNSPYQQWTFRNYTNHYWNLLSTSESSKKQKENQPFFLVLMKYIVNNLKKQKWLELYSFLFPSIASHINASNINSIWNLNINSPINATSKAIHLTASNQATKKMNITKEMHIKKGNIYKQWNSKLKEKTNTIHVKKVL